VFGRILQRDDVTMVYGRERRCRPALLREKCFRSALKKNGEINFGFGLVDGPVLLCSVLFGPTRTSPLITLAVGVCRLPVYGHVACKQKSQLAPLTFPFPSIARDSGEAGRAF
jgi:hypothetical protein